MPESETGGRPPEAEKPEEGSIDELLEGAIKDVSGEQAMENLAEVFEDVGKFTEAVAVVPELSRAYPKLKPYFLRKLEEVKAVRERVREGEQLPPSEWIREWGNTMLAIKEERLGWGEAEEPNAIEKDRFAEQMNTREALLGRINKQIESYAATEGGVPPSDLVEDKELLEQKIDDFAAGRGMAQDSEVVGIRQRRE